MIAGNGDHAGIVRAILKRGDVGFPSILFSICLQSFSQATVGRYTAGDANGSDAGFKSSRFYFIQQNFNDPLLNRGADVGQIFLDE